MVKSEKSKHATVKLYWIFAGILCVITLVEWLIFRNEELRSNATFMVPALSILSLMKFSMVCGWYMHLRYDNKILMKVFGFSAFMAAVTFGILLLAI
ncbi:MAG: cytochrome C oxidase subunit IV family protein [Deltaproteobacteria bacterium]|nr:cytochrome C oxidase subunit IV family protein [Deltaproteobacteria bacterium]